MGSRRARFDLPLMVLAAAIPLPAAAAQDPLRLPLTFLRNSPVTSIEVGGHDTKVIVDTGGGVLSLSADALAQAGAVEVKGEPNIGTDPYGQVHEARRFRVPRIRIGGRLFTNLDAIEARDETPNGPPVPNSLGREFLRQFIVLIDYPARMMTLLSPETADVEVKAMGCTGTRVPFEQTSEHGLAITQVKLDGGTIRLLWDTGATYSSLPASVVATYQLTVTPTAGEKPPFYNTKRVIIGGVDFGALEFVVLPLKLPTDFDGLLGYNLFAKHVVCLNYKRSELRVR